MTTIILNNNGHLDFVDCRAGGANKRRDYRIACATCQNLSITLVLYTSVTHGIENRNGPRNSSEPCPANIRMHTWRGGLALPFRLRKKHWFASLLPVLRFKSRATPTGPYCHLVEL